MSREVGAGRALTESFLHCRLCVKPDEDERQTHRSHSFCRLSCRRCGQIGFWFNNEEKQTTHDGARWQGYAVKLLPREILPRDFCGQRLLHSSWIADWKSDRQVDYCFSVTLCYTKFFSCQLQLHHFQSENSLTKRCCCNCRGKKSPFTKKLYNS